MTTASMADYVPTWVRALVHFDSSGKPTRRAVETFATEYGPEFAATLPWNPFEPALCYDKPVEGIAEIAFPLYFVFERPDESVAPPTLRRAFDRSLPDAVNRFKMRDHDVRVFLEIDKEGFVTGFHSLRMNLWERKTFAEIW